jgi:hypothetical protein
MANKGLSATQNALYQAPASASGADADDSRLVPSTPEWQKPLPKETWRDWVEVLVPGQLLCGLGCGGVWHVEQDSAGYLEDSKEGHTHYAGTFVSAVYALASTVCTMYVTVVQLVTKRMAESDATRAGLLERCAWGYLIFYPLLIMIIIICVCLETVCREYLFYAYLRNGILLDLDDANANLISLAYWDPRRASYGLFPHVALLSTVILGLVTRGLDYPLLIVCVQSVNLLIFFNNIITLKSRLVSVSEFAHPTVVARTAATQAKVAAIQARQLALDSKGLDLDGDGTVDVRCCFAGESALDTPRTPAQQALDAELAAAYVAHATATAAAVAEMGALLARFEIVTEADTRADYKSLMRDSVRISEAKRNKKIGKEESSTRRAKLRYCFGERDAATGARLPTLGLMRRATVARTAESALTHWVANVVYIGLIDKVWAFGAVAANKRRYAGAAAATHARFGKRNVMLLYAAFFVVCCIEIYGLAKGGQSLDGSATCEEQTIAICQSATCFDSVCGA